MPALSKEQKSKNRVNRVLKRFMDRREFAMAALAAGLVGGSVETASAEPPRSYDYTDVLHLAYECIAAAAYMKEISTDSDYNDPHMILPPRTPEANIKKGREWFKWRVQGYFMSQVAANKWPDEAGYVLFNAVRMGAHLAESKSPTINPAEMKEAFLWIKANAIKPDAAGARAGAQKKGPIRKLDMWCSN